MHFFHGCRALSPDGAMPRGITKLPIYKQETSKFSEDETLKLLADLKRFEASVFIDLMYKG